MFEDTSEFDIEPSTKDVATNTSPWKDSEAEVKRLEEVIQNQERTLRNNTSVIANLQRLLQRHLCLKTIFLCTMVQEWERDRGLLHGRSLHVHPLQLFNPWFFKPSRQRPRPRSPRSSLWMTSSNTTSTDTGGFS